MVSILQKLFTLGRGKVTEAGQSVVDSNAQAILDQEIRDARTQADAARRELAQIMATNKLEGVKLEDIKKKQAECSDQIKACLAKGQSDLAREVAERLAHIEADLVRQQALVETYTRNIQTLRTNVSRSEEKIRQVEQQADLARAAASVIRAQQATSSASSGVNSALGNASESLKRLQDKQAHESARLDAAAEIEAEAEGTDLDRKLADAGIVKPSTASVDDILARFGAGAPEAK